MMIVTSTCELACGRRLLIQTFPLPMGGDLMCSGRKVRCSPKKLDAELQIGGSPLETTRTPCHQSAELATTPTALRDLAEPREAGVLTTRLSLDEHSRNSGRPP